MWDLRWLEIFVWFNCNQKCLFCFQKDLRNKDSNFIDYNYVLKLLYKWKKEWKKSVIFSWWEPTLDKNLIKYIKYSQKIWYTDIRIHSNWLKFSSERILHKYISWWVNGIIISIHWYWEIHDRLIWITWAFQKLKKTFINLSKIKKENKNFVIDTNTVLTKYNYKNLKYLYKFLSYFPITRAQLVQLYSLYLFSNIEKKNLYVSYNKFWIELSSILDIRNINITLENFPLCKVDKNYWSNIIKRSRYNNEAYWNLWEWLEESDCTYLWTCVGCKYKDICTGIPKDYLKIFPKEHFII